MTVEHSVGSSRIKGQLDSSKRNAKEFLTHGEDGKWTFRRSDIRDYQATFGDLLLPHFNSFESVVKELKAANNSVFALDLMSFGAALRDLHELDGGISIGLHDIRVEDETTHDRFHNLSFHAGDVLANETLSFMQNWISSQRPELPYFDLIFCRPLGGYLSIREEHYIPYVFGLRKIFRLLNPNGGIALIQLPITKEKFDEGNIRKLLKLNNLHREPQIKIAPTSRCPNFRFYGENLFIQNPLLQEGEHESKDREHD
ncbi:MAG: hypothetical protein AAB966_05210 [Patescibacteria group bacterium]